MGVAPARTCSKPGCRGIVRESICTICGPQRRGGWQPDAQRGTRHQRGYDAAWVALRKQFILDKTMEAVESGASLFPICQICHNPVEKSGEIHVDHIKAFEGLEDPLRLDAGNLRITHYRCHMRAHGLEAAAAPRSPRAQLPRTGLGGSDSQPLPPRTVVGPERIFD
jgi:5-methylcytosine-specific restriction protein A